MWGGGRLGEAGTRQLCSGALALHSPSLLKVGQHPLLWGYLLPCGSREG